MSRFSILPASAVLDTRLSLRELSVLAAIGLHTDRAGWCYPSSERLGELLGVTGPMVRRSIQALAQAGYLEVKPRHNADGGQTSNLIRVLFDATPPAEVLRSPKDRTPATSEVAPPVTPEVTPPVTPEVTPPVTSGVTLTDPFNDPFNDKPLPPSAASPSGGKEAIELPDWIPLEAWTEWMKVRKKKRAAQTPFALKLAIKRLNQLRAEGHDPEAVLTQSAFRGYTDLYPIKSTKDQNHESANQFERRRGESLVAYSQRINAYHDEREAREQLALSHP